MSKDELLREMLDRANETVARLKLMDEIGAFAYCRLTEEQIKEQIIKYQVEK